MNVEAVKMKVLRVFSDVSHVANMHFSWVRVLKSVDDLRSRIASNPYCRTVLGDGLDWPS